MILSLTYPCHTMAAPDDYDHLQLQLPYYSGAITDGQRPIYLPPLSDASILAHRFQLQLGMRWWRDES